MELAEWISATVHQTVAEAETVTGYRQPLVGFASANDPRFTKLSELVHPSHVLPRGLLPGAQTVVSFFLPFAPEIVQANARERQQVARQWAEAYVETNALIGRITAQLIELLRSMGLKGAAEPATHNFDHGSLVSHWSHKSVAVIAGLGSFGLHHMVITDAGCAGRFGSVVFDAPLPTIQVQPRERCLYFHDGSCLECVLACPVSALDASEPIDRQRCWQRLRQVAGEFGDVGLADVCGKCAVGPCSLQSAVP